MGACFSKNNDQVRETGSLTTDEDGKKFDFRAVSSSENSSRREKANTVSCFIKIFSVLSSFQSIKCK